MTLLSRKSQTLISPCCAASILDLDESTIRKGLAGTDTLTHVRRGQGKRQRLSLILEEVIMLKSSWIEAAERPAKRLGLTKKGQ